MTQLTSGEADNIRKATHESPCPWSKGALGAVSLLIVLGGAILAVYATDIRELRGWAQTNRENIRGMETDIKYIREALDRIEACVGRPRAGASPEATPGAVAALPGSLTIP